jgi:hypothetical protein
MKNIFDKNITDEIANRIDKLTPGTTPLWGKMDVAKMLAHCNVTYELVYDNTHPKPNALMRFILKTFVKKSVVNEIPYKKNGSTAPVFIIKDERKFETEKQRLIAYIQQTQQLGTGYFEGKQSHGFGNLTANEWNNMFYKHINHHLAQFGV